MSNTNETSAGILREMRETAGTSPVLADYRLIREYADRLEAAAKREREMSKGLSKKLDKNHAIPGNAAAMREALMKAKLYFDHRGEGTNLDDAGRAIDAITSISAALAAPARNCDRFKDAEIARQVWLDDAENWDEFGSPKIELCPWLFAKADGKEESNG